MELNEDQITSFRKLYKEELEVEITRVEAKQKALALLRFMRLPLIKFKEPVEESDIFTEFAE